MADNDSPGPLTLPSTKDARRSGSPAPGTLQPHHDFVRVKKGGRWVVEVPAPDASPSSGTKLTFTRKGVEVTGWYDHFCGTGNGWELSWAELEAIRNTVWNS